MSPISAVVMIVTTVVAGRQGLRGWGYALAGTCLVGMSLGLALRERQHAAGQRDGNTSRVASSWILAVHAAVWLGLAVAQHRRRSARGYPLGRVRHRNLDRRAGRHIDGASGSGTTRVGGRRRERSHGNGDD